jgi:hypothetical protein
MIIKLLNSETHLSPAYIISMLQGLERCLTAKGDLSEDQLHAPSYSEYCARADWSLYKAASKICDVTIDPKQRNAVYLPNRQIIIPPAGAMPGKNASDKIQNWRLSLLHELSHYTGARLRGDGAKRTLFDRLFKNPTTIKLSPRDAAIEEAICEATAAGCMILLGYTSAIPDISIEYIAEQLKPEPDMSDLLKQTPTRAVPRIQLLIANLTR